MLAVALDPRLAALCEVLSEPRSDPVDHGEAVRSGAKRECGLVVGYRGGKLARFGDVGRIGRDEVELFSPKGFKEIPNADLRAQFVEIIFANVLADGRLVCGIDLAEGN